MKNYFGLNNQLYLGFNDFWLMLIGIPVSSLLINAMIFPGELLNNSKFFFGNCLVTGLAYTVVYWITYRQLLILSRKHLSSNSPYIFRLILIAAGVLIVYFLLKLMLDPLLHPLVDKLISNNTEHELSMSIAALLVTFLVITIYETAWFHHQLKKVEVERAELIKENIQSQLESLKTQVNPHFLFNSLNTLVYLIPKDAEKAERFVHQLSRAYRYILEIRNKELVSVQEELDFLSAYTCLLNERFGESLNIQVNVPDEYLNYQMVPLSLQMLFENAIKHNITSMEAPLLIEVFVEGGQKLVVKNNLQLKTQPIPSTKVGLENIRNRYHFYAGKEVEIINSKKYFTVILPLIPDRVLSQSA